MTETRKFEEFEKMTAEEFAAMVSPKMAAELLIAVHGETRARQIVKEGFSAAVQVENVRAGRSFRR